MDTVDSILGVAVTLLVTYGVARVSYEMAFKEAHSEFKDLQWWELIIKVIYWLGAIFIGALFLPALIIPWAGGMPYNFGYTLALFVVMTISALFGWHWSKRNAK
jgi:hypothetical protein